MRTRFDAPVEGPDARRTAPRRAVVARDRHRHVARRTAAEEGVDRAARSGEHRVPAALAASGLQRRIALPARAAVGARGVAHALRAVPAVEPREMEAAVAGGDV